MSTQVTFTASATLTWFASQRTLLVRQGTKTRTYRLPQGDISYDEGSRHVAVFYMSGKLARDLVFPTAERASAFAQFLITASTSTNGVSL